MESPEGKRGSFIEHLQGNRQKWFLISTFEKIRGDTPTNHDTD